MIFILLFTFVLKDRGLSAEPGIIEIDLNGIYFLPPIPITEKRQYIDYYPRKWVSIDIDADMNWGKTTGIKT